jgi:transposase InsO family protein
MISAPDRRKSVELIEGATRAGARCEKACKELGVSLRTYQRWTQEGSVKIDGRVNAQRPEPTNKLTREERENILEICTRKEYRSLPPSQIVPALADKDTYIASEASFYRVLKKANQLSHRGKAQAPRKVGRPKGYKATGPNQIWSWDITYLAAAITGIFYRLYLVMDIYSRKIVGWEIHESETAEHASVLIRKTCLAEGISEKGLVLHSDNGSPMKGATMLATLQRLGVVPSFSRPSVSDDNPYSESLFRTLKYTPPYPSKPFESLEAARGWVHTFVRWYNEKHRHSSIRFVTPAERHSAKERDILTKREALYAAAKAQHPERWSGKTRNWTPIDEVWLNPENPEVSEDEIIGKAA